MSSPDPKQLKLKQLRLPFAPINKYEGSQKKRKNSGPDAGLPESKIFRSEPEDPPSSSAPVVASPSRKGLRSQPCSSSSSSSSPLVVSVMLGDGEHAICELAESSSIKDKKQTIRVEIGRLSIEIMECKDAMDKAVEKQDFLLAQQHKVTLESLSSRKQDLQNKLQSNISDVQGLQMIVNDIGAYKNTPELKKAPPRMDEIATPQNDTFTPKRKRKISDEEKTKRKEEERAKKEMEKQIKERERENEKIEKQKKKEEERLIKERKREEERLEKERRREEERIEKEKKREEEKLEKERKKELERLEKDRKKNEERLEKLRLEELERKKREKTVQSFASFFLKKDKHGVEESHRSGSNFLNSFQVKSNMRLAPVSRSSFDNSRKNKLDQCLSSSSHVKESSTYLSLLKSSDYERGACLKTWVLDPKDDGDDDVEVLDEEDDVLDEISGTVNADDEARKQTKQKLKAKLLQFHENQRPPYWGTWTKKSDQINGRRPFGTDKHFFDYDYDSDDDWEEEEQGESLSDDDDDDKEEEDAQEDDDDGFFVGHGVLDKDEILHDDEEEEGEGSAEGGYNEDLELIKQKLKAQAFEEEYKRKKPMKLKPKVFGCLWIGNDSTTHAFAAEQLSKILSPMSAVVLGEGTIQTSISSASLSSPLNQSAQGTPGLACDSETPSARRGGVSKSIPQEAMFDLIRLIHANSHNKVFLAKEFSAYWEKQRSSPSENGVHSTPVKHTLHRKTIINKINEIAEYKKVAELNRKAWVVKEDILYKYVPKGSPLEIPNNSWSYNLEQPSGINSKSSVNITPKATPEQNSEVSVANPSLSVSATPKSLITNFVKVLTPEEREKQMKKPRSLTPSSLPPSSLAPPLPKKRATLICLGKAEKKKNETMGED